MKNLIIAIVLLIGTATMTAQSSVSMKKIDSNVMVKKDLKKIETAIVIGRKGNTKKYHIDGYSSCSKYMRDVQDGIAKLPEGWSLKTLTCFVVDGVLYIEKNTVATKKITKRDH